MLSSRLRARPPASSRTRRWVWTGCCQLGARAVTSALLLRVPCPATRHPGTPLSCTPVEPRPAAAPHVASPQVADLHAAALAEDAAIFDYDSHYDAIQAVGGVWAG